MKAAALALLVLALGGAQTPIQAQAASPGDLGATCHQADDVCGCWRHVPQGQLVEAGQFRLALGPEWHLGRMGLFGVRQARRDDGARLTAQAFPMASLRQEAQGDATQLRAQLRRLVRMAPEPFAPKECTEAPPPGKDGFQADGRWEMRCSAVRTREGRSEVAVMRAVFGPDDGLMLAVQAPGTERERDAFLQQFGKAQQCPP